MPRHDRPDDRTSVTMSTTSSTWLAHLPGLPHSRRRAAAKWPDRDEPTTTRIKSAQWSKTRLGRTIVIRAGWAKLPSACAAHSDHSRAAMATLQRCRNLCH